MNKFNLYDFIAVIITGISFLCFGIYILMKLKNLEVLIKLRGKK